MSTALTALFINSIPWLALPWLLLGIRVVLRTMIADDRRSRESIGAHACNTTPLAVHIGFALVTLLFALASVFAVLVLVTLFATAAGFGQ